MVLLSWTILLVFSFAHQINIKTNMGIAIGVILAAYLALALLSFNALHVQQDLIYIEVNAGANPVLHLLSPLA